MTRRYRPPSTKAITSNATTISIRRYRYSPGARLPRYIVLPAVSPSAFNFRPKLPWDKPAFARGGGPRANANGVTHHGRQSRLGKPHEAASQCVLAPGLAPTIEHRRATRAVDDHTLPADWPTRPLKPGSAPPGPLTKLRSRGIAGRRGEYREARAERLVDANLNAWTKKLPWQGGWSMTSRGTTHADGKAGGYS